MLLSLLLLTACASKAPEPSPSADAPATQAVATDATASLHGTRPDAPVPPPTFSAVTQDGEPRSREHLLGHPTVLWFFPFAGTPG